MANLSNVRSYFTVSYGRFSVVAQFVFSKVPELIRASFSCHAAPKAGVLAS